jgi:hypothetical protein
MNSIVASLLPSSATRVVVYLQPISMSYGDVRLRQLCRDVLGMEPDPLTAFLFTNKQRNCLLLYSAPSTGDRTLLKKLERGTFPLPVPDEGQTYAVMKPTVLRRLFSS